MEKELKELLISKVTKHQLKDSEVTVNISKSCVTGHTVETNSYSTGSIISTSVVIKSEDGSITLNVSTHKIDSRTFVESIISALNADLVLDNIGKRMDGSFFEFINIPGDEKGVYGYHERELTKEEVEAVLWKVVYSLESTRNDVINAGFNGDLNVRVEDARIVIYYNGIKTYYYKEADTLLYYVKKLYDSIQLSYSSNAIVVSKKNDVGTSVYLSSLNTSNDFINCDKLIQYLEQNRNLFYQLNNKRIAPSILDGCKDYMFGRA